MIVAGFGFTSRATADSLRAALAATGHTGEVHLMGAPYDKALSPCILDLARELQVSIKTVMPDQLEAIQTRTQSVLSRMLRRTGSVAEAAALAAAGPGATLIRTRCISHDRMATCAIAKGAAT